MTVDAAEGTAIAVMNMNISNDKKSPEMPGSYKTQNVSEWGAIIHGTEESKLLYAKTFWTCSPICTTQTKLFIYANNNCWDIMHIMHMKDYLLTDNTHVQGKMFTLIVPFFMSVS